MATIEERAHNYGVKAAGGHYIGGWRGDIYEGHRDAYIEIATEQRKIDVEERFGTLNHIQSVLQSIINSSERLTSGNIAHNKASIKLLASGLLNYINEI